jgi:hypothetical protein
MKILDREINDVDDNYDREIIQILHKPRLVIPVFRNLFFG